MLNCFQEVFAFWEALYAVGQIGVGLAAAGNVMPKQWNDVARVEVVERSYQRAVRCCQFQDHHASTGLQHPQHLPETLF